MSAALPGHSSLVIDPPAEASAQALLCVDIGNTHVHVALQRNGDFSHPHDIPTALLEDPALGLPAYLVNLPQAPSALAFCSVVPAATPRLLSLASSLGLPAWQLTHEAQLGLPISYPNPGEIGQDRLAHAVGASVLHPGRPVVVIGLGTAVTFDLITPAGGYEGGILAPGPALVTRYLHERTAQLPLVTDLTTPIKSVIGKSTAEAIRIGAIVGFAGLIQALLDAVLAEFAARGLPPAEILLAGGAAQVVEGRLRQPARTVPRLGLLGLAAAWHLNRP